MTSILCPRAMRLATNASVFPAPLALARAHYSSTTASSRPFNQQRPRPAITAHILASRFPSRATASSVRNASTATSTSAQQPPQDALTWDRFFDLRRKRRFINLGASIVTAGTTVLVVGPIIAQQDIDSWAAQLSGMDPMIVLGLSTFAVAGGGWLCGPSFGNAMFSLWASRRGWNKLIAEKEKSFYARIKRYRGDPAHSSPQSPVPDYYGEKIASVKDYRRWLKDQRAFNLKRSKNII